MGLFVVFEGVEGSGKSTQSKALHLRLAKAGCPVTLLHEPGGTPAGERVRQWLKGNDETTPLAELFLFSAARTSLVETVIRPALKRGKTVVCDRYTDSTLAYQGYGRGLDIETARRVNAVATAGLVPELVVLLDLDPEQGLSRKAGTPPDRFERERTDFHQRVRQGFLELAQEEPQRWLVLDATGPSDALSQSVWERVEQLIG